MCVCVRERERERVGEREWEKEREPGEREHTFLSFVFFNFYALLITRENYVLSEADGNDMFCYNTVTNTQKHAHAHTLGNITVCCSKLTHSFQSGINLSQILQPLAKLQSALVRLLFVVHSKLAQMVYWCKPLLLVVSIWIRVKDWDAGIWKESEEIFEKETCTTTACIIISPVCHNCCSFLHKVQH